ncbi:GspH/FimT family pseudopilin [Neptuniibacter sp. QD34_54]|uniref:GspH/FimT family pseudopilin n=1 Tax=Neptuniibacter sp. QD34_54 TaxID=3398208 RepID=UPI0039F5B8FC
MNKDCSRKFRGHASLRAFSFGFSLIELLIAIAILTILLSVALPSFGQFFQRNQLISEQQKIHSLLSYTRMAAVTQVQNVVICRWDGESGCTGTSASNTLIWPEGALVFVDLDQDRELDEPDEKVLKIFPFSDANQISWNRGETLVYEADGSVRGGSNGTFTIENGGEVYELVISLTGRVRRTI